MSELRLAVKREYFDDIKAGTKTEEYREMTPYWRKRIEGKEFDAVVITLGFPAATDTDRILRFPWRGWERMRILHPVFGADRLVTVFAIRLERDEETHK